MPRPGMLVSPSHVAMCDIGITPDKGKKNKARESTDSGP
jgi:hypothetical protein